mmetsp:Transcript_18465/g.58330  ORF Transcript_18465/g.58330 Transcript_18465/m.58330 type:complete len:152 (+) Transcript_18465:186-641(+)
MRICMVAANEIQWECDAGTQVALLQQGMLSTCEDGSICANVKAIESPNAQRRLGTPTHCGDDGLGFLSGVDDDDPKARLEQRVQANTPSISRGRRQGREESARARTRPSHCCRHDREPTDLMRHSVCLPPHCELLVSARNSRLTLSKELIE